jgi:hypothetical protein
MNANDDLATIDVATANVVGTANNMAITNDMGTANDVATSDVVVAAKQLAAQYQAVVAQARAVSERLAGQLADIDARIERVQTAAVTEEVTAAVGTINEVLDLLGLPQANAESEPAAATTAAAPVAKQANSNRCQACRAFVSPGKPCQRCGAEPGETAAYAAAADWETAAAPGNEAEPEAALDLDFAAETQTAVAALEAAVDPDEEMEADTAVTADDKSVTPVAALSHAEPEPAAAVTASDTAAAAAVQRWLADHVDEDGENEAEPTLVWPDEDEDVAPVKPLPDWMDTERDAAASDDWAFGDEALDPEEDWLASFD